MYILSSAKSDILLINEFFSDIEFQLIKSDHQPSTQTCKQAHNNAWIDYYKRHK